MSFSNCWVAASPNPHAAVCFLALLLCDTAGADAASSSAQASVVPGFEWADTISNDSVMWEITPSLDVVPVLDDSAMRLARHDDAEAVIKLCLAMLEEEQRCVAGHVILCQIFGRVHPCIEFRDGAVHIFLHSLEVEMRLSYDEVPRNTAVIPSLPEQSVRLDSYWHLLRRVGIESFGRFNLGIPGVISDNEDGGNTDVESLDTLVSQLLLDGPDWKPLGLGIPCPVFDTQTILTLRRHRGEVTPMCLEALQSDELWIAAHMLLTQIYATNTMSRHTASATGWDINIDGLTVEIQLVGEQRSIDSAYPRADFERHYIRHRWLMRTATFRD